MRRRAGSSGSRPTSTYAPDKEDRPPLDTPTPPPAPPQPYINPSPSLRSTTTTTPSPPSDSSPAPSPSPRTTRSKSTSSLSARIHSACHFSDEPYNVSTSPRSQAITALYEMHTGPPPKLLSPRERKSSRAAQGPTLVELMEPPHTSSSPDLEPAFGGRATNGSKASGVARSSHADVPTPPALAPASRCARPEGPLTFSKTPPGQATRDRDHTLPPAEVPYYAGYGLAIADREALLLSHWLLSDPDPHPAADSTPDSAPDLGWPTRARWDDGGPPARVLDLGCGIWAHWILHASRCWPTTHFVGLDVAPVLLSLDQLHADQRDRITSIQHNFLPGLSTVFPAGQTFDLIRMGHIGLGVPEHHWEPLIASCLSLLSPRGKLEIIDQELESVAVSSLTEATQMPAAVHMLKDIMYSVASPRFLNLGQFATIRAALAIHAGGVKTAGKTLVSYPARDRARRRGDEGRDWELLVPLVTAPFMRARRAFFLAEYTASLEGDDPPALLRLKPRVPREEAEKALDMFDKVLHMVPLAPLLSSRWDWECAFDKAARDQLTRNVAALTRDQGALEEVWKRRNKWGRMDEQKEDELILARARVASDLREARHELGLVEGRLRGSQRSVWEGEEPEEDEEGEVRGAALGLQSWVASRPLGDYKMTRAEVDEC